jgi:hypothetical protein
MISLQDSTGKSRVSAKTFMLVETRVMPEIQWFRDDLSRELCGILVSIVLELLSMEESFSQARGLLGKWFGDQGGWKGIVEAEIHRTVSLLY